MDNSHIRGLPPRSKDVRIFVADRRDSKIKREELIGRLIGSAEFVVTELPHVAPSFGGCLAHAGGGDAAALVATVHRRTSYKRRPARLYGADDYVEIHRLGEQLRGHHRREVEATDTCDDFTARSE